MELRTETVGNGTERLLENFEAHGVVVPSGFVFDGASAPRIFWNIIPPFKGTKKAACIHDWLCQNARGPSDRKKADKLFYLMCREAGLSRLRCKLAYLGVRAGAFLGIGVYYKEQ